jgi:hypothetical protein
MSYDQTRDQEQLRLMEPDLLDFVTNFDPSAPTVMLLPGGMASALLQATKPFPGNNPPYAYETDWLAANIICGAANKLAMATDIDSDDHITVPRGTIGFMGITPYIGFELWCLTRQPRLNYIILSWDWRRRIESTVNFLRDTVLPTLRQRVKNAYNVDILQTEFYLIAHSFGGLVLKQFLDRGGPFVNSVRRAISVGTNFYGYGGSQHFYFAGFSYLASFYPKSQLAMIIGSMRGPYTLMFLDQVTYGKISAKLAADPVCPLNDYPSVDATNTSTSVDPYNPLPTGSLMRYPDGGWVDMGELAHAKLVRQAIAAPLPVVVQKKFFHIRGVQTSNGNPINKTIVSQKWAAIPAGFDPDTDPDPIQSVNGRGDGTVPGWSARLVDAPDKNVITITKSVDHITLLDNPAVLSTIEQLMGIPEPFMARQTLTNVFQRTWRKTASVKETLGILSEASSFEDIGQRRDFLAKLSVERQKSIARRILKEVLKPPARPVSIRVKR